MESGGFKDLPGGEEEELMAVATKDLLRLLDATAQVIFAMDNQERRVDVLHVLDG